MDEYLEELYGADVDVDTQLAAAGEVLEKIAAEEGMDLSEYDEEDIGEMLMKISGLDDLEEYEDDYGDELTVADMAAELSKVAADEGIDLDELSREEQHDAFNWVAEQMSDPGYFEMSEKVAEADMLGRAMAQGFEDELGLEKQAVDFRGMYERGLRSLGGAASKAERKAANKGMRRRAKKWGAKKSTQKRMGKVWRKAYLAGESPKKVFKGMQRKARQGFTQGRNAELGAASRARGVRRAQYGAAGLGGAAALGGGAYAMSREIGRAHV